LALGIATIGQADVVMQIMIDSNAVPTGFIVGGVSQATTWTGVYTGATNSFGGLHAQNGTGYFSVNVTGFGTISGSVTSAGGAFYVGASGGGIISSRINDGQSWTFTFFSHSATLTDINYTGPDLGQQAVLVGGVPVHGSPFDVDVTGTNITVPAGNALQFGYVENAGSGYTLVDFTMTIATPTRITLTEYYTTEYEGGTRLVWRTASEENTVGFYVYREVAGQWVKVNENLIPALGGENGDLGGDYYVDDPGAPAEERCRYKLVEVETSGRVIEYDSVAGGTLKVSAEMRPEGFTVCWPSVNGERYTLQRVIGATGEFQDVENHIGATPPLNCFSIADDDSFGAAFYCIRIE